MQSVRFCKTRKTAYGGKLFDHITKITMENGKSIYMCIRGVSTNDSSNMTHEDRIIKTCPSFFL